MNGAVQGVATRTASAPEPKDRALPGSTASARAASTGRAGRVRPAEFEQPGKIERDHHEEQRHADTNTGDCAESPTTDCPAARAAVRQPQKVAALA
jgi:hypothetical protein